MTTKTLQPSKVGKTQNSPLQSPNSHKYAAVRTREYSLVTEIEAMRDALRKSGGCHAHRDSTLRSVDLSSRTASCSYQQHCDGSK